MIHKIVVPSLGATGGDAEVLSWFSGVGDQVKEGRPLFSIQTDKAVFDVEAFRSGYLRKIDVPSGMVPIGTVVGIITDTADEPIGDTVEHQATAVDEPPDKPVDEALSGGTPALLTRDDLLAMYRRMVLIRRFEDYLYKLFLSGQVPGTLHQCQGQEAVAVGVCRALFKDDLVFSTHRPVGHHLAKGGSPRSVAAEIWGKATGCCGGKGGQMHLADVGFGIMPSNAIVGANIPIATGAALAFKMKNERRVAVSFFGDGAANIGAFHEGLNFAAVTSAPVVFVCENNLYAASTHISRTMRIQNIADRATSYGIPGEIVDGMDASAVYRAARQAVERARKGDGPTLLECKTYRYAGHSRGDPRRYRSPAEVTEWEAKDPLIAMRGMLAKEHGVEQGVFDAIGGECQAEVEDAVRFAQESPEPETRAAFHNVLKES